MDGKLDGTVDGERDGTSDGACEGVLDDDGELDGRPDGAWYNGTSTPIQFSSALYCCSTCENTSSAFWHQVATSSVSFFG